MQSWTKWLQIVIFSISITILGYYKGRLRWKFEIFSLQYWTVKVQVQGVLAIDDFKIRDPRKFVISFQTLILWIPCNFIILKTKKKSDKSEKFRKNFKKTNSDFFFLVLSYLFAYRGFYFVYFWSFLFFFFNFFFPNFYHCFRIL